MSHGPQARSWAWWAIGSLVVLAAMGAASWLHEGPSPIDELRDLVDAAQARAAARDPRRPFPAEPQPGNAFEAYAGAGEAALRGDRPAALAALAEGAGRGDVRARWDAEPPAGFRGLGEAGNVISAAIEAQLGAREYGDAVRLAAVGLTFASDLASEAAGSMRFSGDCITADLVRRFPDDVLAALPECDARVLSVRLQDVDERLVPGVEWSAAYSGSLLLAGTYHPAPWRRSPWRAWFSGFDTAMYDARELVTIERAYAALPDPRTSPWSQRAAALERVTRDLVDAGCDVCDHERIEIGCRRHAVALRLLRLAVLWHLRDPLPELRDPLGDGMLRVTVAGDEATFSSACREARTARRR